MANTTSLTGLSKDILREKYILEGSKVLLEIINPEYFKLLTESDNSNILLEEGIKDFFNKVVNKISNSKTKKSIIDLFSGLPWLQKNYPQLLGLMIEFAQVAKKENISLEDIKSTFFSKKEITKEAVDTSSQPIRVSPTTKLLNPIWAKMMSIVPEAGSAKRIITALFFNLLFATNMIGAPLVNYLQNTKKIPVSVSQATKFNSNKPDTFVLDFTEDGGKVLDAPLPGIYPDDDGSTTIVKTDGAQSPYQKGTQFTPEGEKSIDDLADEIKQNIEDGMTDITVYTAGSTSDTMGKDTKMNDTNKSGEEARQETGEEDLKQSLEKKGVDTNKIKFKKAKTNPSDERKNPKKGSQKGAGVIYTIKGTIPPSDAPPVAPSGLEAAVYDVNIDKIPKPPGGETPRPIGGETPITAPDDFSRLNRNGQIATVLAGIDPKLNIAQYKEIGPIKSYTDNELLNPNIKDEKAKELARLIVNIRKNPNSLLKKVSKATGLPFNVRAKAVSTRASKSTQAQLQSPTVKETQELFQEALVDDIFTKLGIQDSDLAKNKIKLAGYLGSMYAKEGDTDLSILNTDKLSDDDKKELQKVGFGFDPQSGNNYVFLKGRSAADVGVTRKKLQPDAKRALDAVAQRKNELKSYFNNINNRKEFAGVIVGIIKYLEPDFQEDISKIRAALTKIRQEITVTEAINDPSSEIDVQKLIGRIEKNAFLVQALQNINNTQELIDFLANIIPYVTKLEPDEKKLAFQDAENVLILLSKQNKPTGGTGQTNEMQRMQELAGIKTR
jgi:hypothetical protein